MPVRCPLPAECVVFVAAVHAASEFLDLDASVDKACRLIAGGRGRGARLIVFPDVPTGVSVLDLDAHAGRERAALCELYGQSVELPGDATRRLGHAARDARAWVCIGVNEREGGTLYNTLVWFDDQGTLVARHRKLQPTNVERTIWAAATDATSSSSTRRSVAWAG